MNAEKAINFLNCTSINPDFDEFMLQSGIKKRPQGKDALETFYTPDKQVSLTFQEKEVIEDIQLFPIIGKGKYVLINFEVHSSYIGALPYQLDFSDSEIELTEKLGELLEKLELANRTNLTYYHNNVLITFFVSKQGKINIISFSAPNIYDVKNLGIKKPND